MAPAFPTSHPGTPSIAYRFVPALSNDPLWIPHPHECTLMAAKTLVGSNCPLCLHILRNGEHSGHRLRVPEVFRRFCADGLIS